MIDTTFFSATIGGNLSAWSGSLAPVACLALPCPTPANQGSKGMSPRAAPDLCHLSSNPMRRAPFTVNSQGRSQFWYSWKRLVVLFVPPARVRRVYDSLGFNDPGKPNRLATLTEEKWTARSRVIPRPRAHYDDFDPFLLTWPSQRPRPQGHQSYPAFWDNIFDSKTSDGARELVLFGSLTAS